MIEVKETPIEELLDRVISNLPSNKKYQLVSITKKIKEVNTLHFFEGAKALNKDRIFWTSTAEQYDVVGIGNAYEIHAKENRFEITENKWNELLANAKIFNPYQVAGTGVVALGGMAFDPKKEQTHLWEKFSPSQFTIPAFILTKNNNNYYFTINTYVTKDDHPRQLATEIEHQESLLFRNMEQPSDHLTINEKIEVKPDKWRETVRQAREAIRTNKAEKIVLAREMRLKFNKEANIASILQKLIDKHANSYIFAFEKGEDCFVGATPERLVKLNGEQLLSTCLAGTAPRGKTKEEDLKISQDLLKDEKNRQEHEFVVKMIKGALETYSTEIEIPNEPIVYPLKNLQHLYTPVTAILKDGYSIFDIVKQLHPTPALGGTPNKESMAFIRDHELLDRGWYGAPVGWLDSNQNSEFAVAIRSGLIQGNEASLFAGGGIVKDSNLEEEYEETTIKFKPMLSVLGD
ncbi:menaquinone-specific isochorismate synthase [Virgibacillus natechei]|uniref:Isochorismate synthase MenF n=1 Tax=Virgibacillus natechei TaxID=1216297 RepID=A0ABS4IF33_9BACI|nr:isochorismate synthase [Virgibacillus natechei]MBP1969553.1 menaquinone-specific isochorismate synthase [Virgibacillus natechei]UZD11748.1 isochorismate synthase [Virgibacillus natechei]